MDTEDVLDKTTFIWILRVILHDALKIVVQFAIGNQTRSGKHIPVRHLSPCCVTAID